MHNRCHIRTKNGHPHQSTTGVASANSTNASVRPLTHSCTPDAIDPIAITSSGADRMAPSPTAAVSYRQVQGFLPQPLQCAVPAPCRTSGNSPVHRAQSPDASGTYIRRVPPSGLATLAPAPSHISDSFPALLSNLGMHRTRVDAGITRRMFVLTLRMCMLLRALATQIASGSAANFFSHDWQQK